VLFRSDDRGDAHDLGWYAEELLKYGVVIEWAPGASDDDVRRGSATVLAGVQHVADAFRRVLGGTRYAAFARASHPRGVKVRFLAGEFPKPSGGGNEMYRNCWSEGFTYSGAGCTIGAENREVRPEIHFKAYGKGMWGGPEGITVALVTHELAHVISGAHPELQPALRTAAAAVNAQGQALVRPFYPARVAGDLRGMNDWVRPEEMLPETLNLWMWTEPGGRYGFADPGGAVYQALDREVRRLLR
jgi:hypothetical protein